MGAQHVLVIVQNLPVPLDRRVTLECRALVAAGYEVSVICPKGPGDRSREEIDGIHVYKYRPAPQADGVAGYLWEFVYSWIRTALLSLVVWRRAPFQVLQACNPPDTYWALARLWRSRGVRFVFDQHDLNPELFLSRFGVPRSLGGRVQLAGLRWLEQRTYRAADHVISTNESYAAIARGRGRHDAADVTVVRSGPDTSTMRPVYPPVGTQRPRRFSLVYLGIMGPQDGVDTIVTVMDELVHRRGRHDVSATLLGFGDCLEELREQTTRLGLDDVITFTGRADKDVIARHLSTADVGLCPDLKTPLNDVSTMNKTMEYMAYALPSVSFDLVETRVSGADTVLYVDSGDVQAFADQVERLLDDDDLRLDLALRARARVASELDWRAQAEAYVGVYDTMFGHDPRPTAVPVAEPRSIPRQRGRAVAAPTTDPGAPAYVDLDDAAELRRFVLQRTRPDPATPVRVPHQAPAPASAAQPHALVGE